MDGSKQDCTCLAPQVIVRGCRTRVVLLDVALAHDHPLTARFQQRLQPILPLSSDCKQTPRLLLPGFRCMVNPHGQISHNEHIGGFPVNSPEHHLLCPRLLFLPPQVLVHL